MYFHFCLVMSTLRLWGSLSLVFFGSFSRNNTPFLRETEELQDLTHTEHHRCEEHFVIYPSQMQTLKLLTI